MLPIEFEDRAWVPHGGWPITRAELEPFYRKAHDICDLGDYSYGVENWRNLGFPEPQFSPEKVEPRFWRISPPTRFGPKYRRAFEQAGNISVFLNATVTNIQAARDANKIGHIDVLTLDGKSGQVKAKAFVLACGGMDNPRLMLVSNGVEPGGLGNRNDLVGRFFMGHLTDKCAEIVPIDAAKLALMFGKNRTGPVITYPGLCPTERLQREQRILSCGMFITHIPDANTSIGAAKALVGDIKHGRMPDDLAAKLWRILSDLDTLGPAAYKRLVKGQAITAGITSMYMTSRQEQAPNPDSRITLIPERDAVGMNRIRLNWQVTELEKYSARTVTQAIANELGRLNLGRIRIPDWLAAGGKDWTPELRGGNHHMGTTRMADSPKKGVVDRNCQVHGIENMYVAGSSVFSTSGYMNPTMTIVALSLRLAGHLKTLF